MEKVYSDCVWFLRKGFALLPLCLCLVVGAVAGCTSSVRGDAGFHVADVKDGLKNLTTLDLADEIESVTYVPLQNGSFGLGVFMLEGDTAFIKNDFYSSLVPREKSGFTLKMASVYADVSRSVLFKTGSNDTVFRLKE